MLAVSRIVWFLALPVCLGAGLQYLSAQPVTDEATPPPDEAVHSGEFATLTPAEHSFLPYPLREQPPASPHQRQIEALKRLAVPEADDWLTEIDAEHAKHALDDLFSLMAKKRNTSAADVGRFFVDERSIAPLRPDRAEKRPLPGMTVRVFDCAATDVALVPPHVALKALFAPHDPAAEVRSFIKVVGVRPLGEAAYETDLFLEFSSASGRLRLQQNADWTVVWDAGDDRAHPRIREIKVTRMNEARSDRPQFVERTRALIPEDSLWSPRLEYGNEWWFGRLDALGGFNFIGSEGIAIGDVNGNGLEDIYVCMPSGIPNMLLIQQPDGTVRDMAVEANVAWLDHSRGALFIDLDNDGDQDLVVALDSTIGFLENDGTGVFIPRSRFIMPSTNLGAFYSLAAADYDNDGFLDIYACRYQKAGYGVYPPEPYYDADNGPSNHLLRNDGNFRFTDVTVDVGLDVNNRRFSIVATWIDINDNGHMDLYVANDFGRNNLYLNDGEKFVDVAAEMGLEDQASGMGISWADYNHNGHFDVLISNMFSSAGRRVTYQPRSMSGQPEHDRVGLQRLTLGNTLLAADGTGKFVDVSQQAGIQMGRWAWGAMFVDINNDGYEDMVVPNGFITGPDEDDL